jgi:hypothetical protein
VRSLYIGTSEGKVLIYPLQYNSATGKVSTVLERERALGHGKKPVSDIIVLDDVGIILTLCGTSSALSFNPDSEISNLMDLPWTS